MAYSQGSVVLAEDMFKNGLRPYLVVSNSTRPFSGEAYTVAVMSTTPRGEAVVVDPEEHIEDGRLNETSFVNPWALYTLRDEVIRRRVAQVSDHITESVCSSASEYIEFIE
jgi:mRNA-degrading endonuclease toxin of MazEF toxin-antitoxin module